MKNIIKLLYLFTIILTSAHFSMADKKQCNQAQAFNKMMAIGRAQTRLINQPDPQSQLKAVEITKETSAVGKMLADKKFSEACLIYDQIALKYNIDIGNESKGMVTFSESAKDGGKRGGRCSQADASKKMMGYYQQLEDRAANGDADRGIITRFSNDTAKINELIYTNPSEVCNQLDGLKEKYSLK